MQYLFTRLPNQGHAQKYRVRDFKSKSETLFSFSYSIIEIWGKPLEPRLENLMIAYLKKKGWVKEPVVITPENAPRNLTTFLESLQKK